MTNYDYEKELEHYLACMTEQRNKYKIAIEKIKDIALKSIENHRYNGNSEYKMILGIINEVLNDRNRKDV